MKKIAIDIDGILTNETTGIPYTKRTPNLAAIRLVNLLGKFVYIYLFTSRYDKDKKITKEWLKNNGVNYKKLVLRKPKYDYLVDDKAI